MIHVHELARVVQVTTTPEELRKLADKMENAMLNIKLGELCFVDQWIGEDVEIRWMFDHEHPSCGHHQNNEFEHLLAKYIIVGDVLSTTKGQHKIMSIKAMPNIVIFHTATGDYQYGLNELVLIRKIIKPHYQLEPAGTFFSGDYMMQDTGEVHHLASVTHDSGNAVMYTRKKHERFVFPISAMIPKRIR